MRPEMNSEDTFKSGDMCVRMKGISFAGKTQSWTVSAVSDVLWRASISAQAATGARFCTRIPKVKRFRVRTHQASRPVHLNICASWHNASPGEGISAEKGKLWSWCFVFQDSKYWVVMTMIHRKAIVEAAKTIQRTIQIFSQLYRCF